eukprot:3387140-Prymnesium_polylepis.1
MTGGDGIGKPRWMCSYIFACYWSSAAPATLARRSAPKALDRLEPGRPRPVRVAASGEQQTAEIKPSALNPPRASAD